MASAVSAVRHNVNVHCSEMPGTGQRSIGEILDEAAVRDGRYRDCEGARLFFNNSGGTTRLLFDASQAMHSDHSTVDGDE